MLKTITKILLLVAIMGTTQALFANEPALVRAVDTQNLEEVSRLLEAGANPLAAKNDGSTAVDFAIRRPSEEIRNLVINHQNAKGETPLIISVDQGNEAMVIKLINAGADLYLAKRDGSNAVNLAIWSDNQVIKSAVINRQDIGAGETPLMRYIVKGDLGMVKNILVAGARFDLLNKKRQDAIHYAISSKNAEIIAAVVNHQDLVTGETPLIRAVHKQDRSDVERLLNTNAVDLYLAKKDGANAIKFATWQPNFDIKYRVMNYRDRQHNNETPLNRAIADGNLNDALTLVKNGAYPYFNNRQGRNAFYFANLSVDAVAFNELLKPLVGCFNSYSGPWNVYDRINMTPELLAFSGNGVNVAIFDSGIDFRVSELGMDRSIPGGGVVFKGTEKGGVFFAEFIDYPHEDLYTKGGHGTRMAKTLAGKVNKEKFRGIAPGVKILSMGSDTGSTFFTSLDYINKRDKIKIASVSLQGMDGFDSIYQQGDDADALLVIIAGNNKVSGRTQKTPLERRLPGKKDLSEPIFRKLIVSVGVDWQNQLTPQSMSCGALGPVCIAVPANGPTSQTAPLVAGLLADLMEAFPGLDVTIYQKAILATATRLETPPEETGVGLLNAGAAFEYLRREKLVL